MNQEHIKSLKEALSLSPDNILLRKMLVTAYFNLAEYDNALTELKAALNYSKNDNDLKLQMAQCYFQLKNYSTAQVIAEELIENNFAIAHVNLLLSKIHLETDDIKGAKQHYDKAANAGVFDSDYEILLNKKLIDSGLASAATIEATDDILRAAEMEKPAIAFKDVGGLESVKEEIALKVIHPLRNPDIYKAYGKKIGGGILLYGPPGCGKTLIARATAGEINASFISVGINDVLDMWVGNSEKNLHDIFQQARMNTPCVLFFDEVDAMGASRNDMRKTNSRFLINQFLDEMDGVKYSNEGILILGATNSPWYLDNAFRRPGRFDRIIFVPPPDQPAREEILKLLMEGKPSESVDMKSIAKATEEYSGADLRAMVDIAIESKLTESMKAGKIFPVTGSDLKKAAARHKATTKDWFTTAKNYALYSNESGLYDDFNLPENQKVVAVMDEDMDNSIEKARMLLQMKRTTEAIGELEKVLAQNPDSYMGLMLACAAYYEQQNKSRIKETAGKFVATYPADDVAHYYMALACSLNKDAKAAESHVRQSIAINPHDADYFGFLAALYIDKSNWKEALTYANQGLEIEPENVLCLNHRTYCLTKLDRKEEILTAVQETLSVSPDSWYSHSNVGWSKLETGDYKDAKYHFAEALRLNPNAEQARAGMRETLKANNFLYRWYLKYQFWLGKFNTQMQWAILIGFIFGRRIVFTLAASFPPLYILAFAMIFFVYSSWIIRPLGDFILMLDRFGRALLSHDEKKAGVAVGIGFLSGLVLCPIGYFTGIMPLVVIGLVLATVVIPIGKYYHEDEETRSLFIKIFTVGITLVGAAVIASQFVGGAEIVTTAYIIGIAAYTWIFNIRQSSN